MTVRIVDFEVNFERSEVDAISRKEPASYTRYTRTSARSRVLAKRNSGVEQLTQIDVDSASQSNSVSSAPFGQHNY